MGTEPNPKRPGRGNPLEDIVVPALFMVVMAVSTAVLHRWLHLPFWAACLLGIPVGGSLVMLATALLILASKPRQ